MNELNIYINNAGRVFNNDNLSLTQFSSNNELIINSELYLDECYITSSASNIRTHAVFIKYDGQYNIYKAQIKEDITGIPIPASKNRITLTVRGYTFENGIAQTVCSGSVFVEIIKSDSEKELDYTYNGQDVNNIWKKLGELTNRLNAIDGTGDIVTNEDLLIAINNHNTSSSSHQDIRNLIKTLDAKSVTTTLFSSNDEILATFEDSTIDSQNNILLTKKDENYKKGDFILATSEKILYIYDGNIKFLSIIGANEEDEFLTKIEAASTYATKTEVSDKANKVHNHTTSQIVDLAEVAKTGSYNDLLNAPTVPVSTSQLINNSGFITKDVVTLTNFYNKAYIDSKINAVYKYKGSCNYSELISKNDAELGDVWNVTDKGNTNYACINARVASPDSWDALGADVDLSSYLTKSEASYTYATTTALNLKANTSDVFNKSEINNLLRDKMTIKDAVSSLPYNSNSTGDVRKYSVDNNYYIWTGTSWDELGGSSSNVSGNISITGSEPLLKSIQINGDKFKVVSDVIVPSSSVVSSGQPLRSLTFNGVQWNISGGDIDLSLYELKADAESKLTESKQYTDSSLENYFNRSETNQQISTAINDLVGGAPSTLNTLKELADAIQDNESLIDTLEQSITNKADKATTYSKVDVDSKLSNKQDKLISGTNIKTINGESILGSGNIEVQGGGNITVDDELSDTSTNPVQNRVIKDALNQIGESSGSLVYASSETQTLMIKSSGTALNDLLNKRY